MTGNITPERTDGFARGDGGAERVCLPHNPHELPLHYCGPEDYEAVCGYRQRLFITTGSRGKRLFLQFDGAAHHAWVYVNGALTAEHSSGYTAFRVEITELAEYGAENLIAVKLDSREDPALPPFGFVIDYLTYSGLYREAWLDIRDENYIEDVFVRTEGSTARISYTVSGANRNAKLRHPRRGAPDGGGGRHRRRLRDRRARRGEMGYRQPEALHLRGRAGDGRRAAREVRLP